MGERQPFHLARTPLPSQPHWDTKPAGN